MKKFYIYIYLDQRHEGSWSYKENNFKYRPFYIGKGRRFRIKQHLQPKQRNDNSIKSNIINSIIKKLNENPIHYKLYEGLSFEEANEIEMSIIKHFGRIDLKTGILSNMTDGGEGFKNMIVTDETKIKMSEKAKGTKTYANNGMSKIVEKYSLDGILLETFSSLRAAAESVNISFKTISSNCRGITKTSGGFIWKYAGKSYNPIVKSEAKDKRKKVYQYDLDGNFIKEWESVSCIEETTKIRHISCVCLGKLNFSGGFQWRYDKLDKLDKLTFEKTKNINRYEKTNQAKRV